MRTSVVQWSFCVAAVLLVTTLTAQAAPVPIKLDRTAPLCAAETASATSRAIAPQLVVFGDADSEPRFAVTQPPILEPEPQVDTVSMPDAPDSAALVLVALGGIGAWRLGSSARKFSISAVPDWFADHGPRQLGHTTQIQPGALQCMPDRTFDRFAVPVALEICDNGADFSQFHIQTNILIDRYLNTVRDVRGPPVARVLG